MKKQMRRLYGEAFCALTRISWWKRRGMTMKYRFASGCGAITLISLCLLSRPAEAQFQSLHGLFIGEPSCAVAADGTGQVTCAAKKTNGMLAGIRFDPRTNFTTAYQNLAFSPPFAVMYKSFLSNPGCASANDGSGQVTCAVVGPPSAPTNQGSMLWAVKFDPRTKYQTPYQLVRVPAAGNPSCASAGKAGEVTCAFNNGIGGIKAVRLDPKTGYVSNVVTLLSDGFADNNNPSCASTDDGSNQVICAVKGMDSDLYGVRFDPKTGYSSSIQNLNFDGIFIDNPSCASTSDGSGEVTRAVKGTDSSLFGASID
jgi:hypothetical protein